MLRTWLLVNRQKASLNEAFWKEIENIQMIQFYIIIILVNKLDEDFIRRLALIISGKYKNIDPFELVNRVYEYIQKNWDKYKDHPNLMAIAILKAKGLYIDDVRKQRNFTNIPVDDEGNEIEIEDINLEPIENRLQTKSELKTTLQIIHSMGIKCREILLLKQDDLSMKEIQLIIGVKSIGTVLSRLSDCRKELRKRMPDRTWKINKWLMILK